MFDGFDVFYGFEVLDGVDVLDALDGLELFDAFDVLMLLLLGLTMFVGFLFEELGVI